MSDTLGTAASSVMGPEGSTLHITSFADKIPPAFDGHGNYASYRQDVELWTHLTTLDIEKHGAALIGRLSGEAKAAAKTLSIATIASGQGVACILQHLDKSYAVNRTDQLDLDLAAFLDFTWSSHLPVDQFIAGFHTRLDRIAELHINSKLKGHLLLRQAGLDHSARGMIIGAAAGSYEVDAITSALRQSYRHAPNTIASNMSRNPQNQEIPGPARKPNRNTNKTRKSQNGNGSRNNGSCTFYTYRSVSGEKSTRAIVDSGACASVVGKDTLDSAMRIFGINSLENTPPSIGAHRFGNHDEEQKTMFAVRFPLICENAGQRGDDVKFYIRFDVIPGKLPFLIGFPSLKSMKANLNFKFNTLGLYLHDQYAKVPLQTDETHIYLPFSSGKKAGSTMYTFSTTCTPKSSPVDSRRNQNITEKGKTAYELPEMAPSEVYSTSYSMHASRYECRIPSPSMYTLEPNLKTRTLINAVSEATTNRDPGHYRLETADQDWHSPRTNVTSIKKQVNSVSRKIFSPQKLKKLHLQLKHGSKTQMSDWIKSVNEWAPHIEQCIDELLTECPCVTAMPLAPHPVVSTRLPTAEKQVDVSIDTVFFEGVPCLHVVCKCTRWSEAAALPSNRLKDQVAAFKRIQIYQHGAPLRIHADNQYDKGEFAALCKELSIEFVPSAANDHESNGAIESANRVLRSFFRRLRAIDHQAPIIDILAEATYGKNICKGQKLASSFELLYGNAPIIMNGYKPSSDPISNKEQAIHTTKQRLNKMLRTKTRIDNNLKIGDYAYFWRDQARWLGPSRVINIQNGIVTLVHDERTKTSSMNRVRKTQPPIEEIMHEEEDRPALQPTIEKESTTIEPPRSPIITRQKTREAQKADQSKQHNILKDPDSLTDSPDSSDSDFEPLGTPGAPWIPNRNNTNFSQYPISNQLYSNDPTENSRNISHESYVSSPSPEIQPGYENPNIFGNEIDAHLQLPPNSQNNPSSSTRQFDDHPTRSATDEVFNPIEIKRGTEILVPKTNPQTPSKSNGTAALITLAEKRDAYAIERNVWEEKEAFKAIPKHLVDIDANIVGSHVVYKRKHTGKVKARIVPWGHRDADKDNLRSDSPCMNPEVFRLVLSISVEMGWPIGEMDIAAAYLQALGFTREIYMKPPKEETKRDVYWKLSKAAYGLADSGRLWYLTSDSALTKLCGLSRSNLEHTLYYRKNAFGKLSFILISQVDNYVYSGEPSEMRQFEHFLTARFHVGERMHNNFTVYGCELSRHSDYSLTVTQRDKIKKVEEPLATPVANKFRQPDRMATPNELSAYRKSIGQILFVGRMTNPLLQRIASQMATKTPALMLHHLKELGTAIKKEKLKVPEIHFAQPSRHSMYSLEVCSDASMTNKNGDSARGGFIIFRRNGDTVHPIHWSSKKIRRVARSSSTAEILAAADAIDVGLYLAHILKELIYEHTIDLSTDSRSLFSLATSVKEPEERRNKIDLSAIRESFDNGMLTSVSWTPGHYLVSDALTKDNRLTASLLTQVLRDGIYPHHPDRESRMSPKGE
eukprot:IDg22319t1